MSTRTAALGGALFLALAASTAVACSDEDSVFNVAVGDCVENVSDLSGNISDLPSIDCTTPHQAQIIHLVEHEGDDFPGVDTLTNDAGEECSGDAFEEFTGTSYDESAIELRIITPTEESWGQGDRESICLGVLNSEEQVDQTFEDNGEDFLLADS